MSIEQSSFKKIRVGSKLIVGKTGLLQKHKQNGKFSGNSVSTWNAVNSGSVRVLTAATDLTVEDSGKVIVLANATGFAVTVPALQAGLNYEFVLQIVLASGNHTITPPDTDKLYGLVTIAADAAGVTASAADVITFVTGVIGNRVKLTCDGTYWYVSGQADLAASITATG